LVKFFISGEVREHTPVYLAEMPEQTGLARRREFGDVRVLIFIKIKLGSVGCLC
jgi:hypothetical protein